MTSSETSTSSPAQRSAAKQPIGTLRLWRLALAGPVVWTVQELLGYVLVGSRCKSGWVPLEWAVQLLGILSILVIGLTIWQSVTSWRAIGVGMDAESGDDGSRGRAGLMALAGIVMGGLFLIIAVGNTIPTFFLNPCLYMG